MGAERNIVMINFADAGDAYQAINRLKQASGQAGADVLAAVVIRRDADGPISASQRQDATIGGNTLGGGLIGLVLGVLGGPLGLLLGWGAGSLVGGYLDARRADRQQTILAEFSSRLLPGETAVLAEVYETVPGVVDGIADGLGGQLIRRAAEDVLTEVESAERAATAAQREAARALVQERRDRRRRGWAGGDRSWDDRINTLKQRLGA